MHITAKYGSSKAANFLIDNGAELNAPAKVQLFLFTKYTVKLSLNAPAKVQLCLFTKYTVKLSESKHTKAAMVVVSST